MDEEKSKEEIKPAEDTGEGIQPTADEKVKQLNADTERINQAIAENENAKARQKLSGVAEAGVQTTPKAPETDEEYTERFLKGEASLTENAK